MTKDEFMSSTINFQELYNKKLNETQLSFWYEELKVYEIEKYKRVIGEFAKTSKTFPALSEVLNKIKNLQERIVVNNPLPDKVACEVCHGSGLVKYYKNENGMDYEYLCKCFCENGERITYPLRKYEDVFYYRKPKPQVKLDAEPIDYDISQINF